MLKAKKGLSILLTLALLINVFSVVMLSDVKVAYAGANLLANANPGLEAGGTVGTTPAAWVAGGSGVTAYLNNSVVRSGSYSILVSNKGTNANASALHYANLTKDKTYIHSAWMRNETAGTSTTFATHNFGNGGAGGAFTSLGAVTPTSSDSTTWYRTERAMKCTTTGSVAFSYLNYSAAINHFVDDTSLEELEMYPAISGASTIAIPKGTDTATSTFTASVTNQLGTTTGLATTNAPTYSWALVGTPKGVSINSSTGVLTLTDEAAQGTVTVRVTAAPSANTPGVSSATADKTVSLAYYVPAINMLTNPGLETGTTGNWNSSGASIELNSAVVRSGSYSLRVFNKASSTSAALNYANVTANKTYIRWAWMRNETSGVRFDTAQSSTGGATFSNLQFDYPEVTNNTTWGRTVAVFKANTSGSIAFSYYNHQNSTLQNPGGNFFIDDAYLEELQMLPTISGGTSTLIIPQGDTNATSTFTASVTNQLGTATGFSSHTDPARAGIPTYSWEVVGSPTGVNINSSGAISVTKNAQPGTVTVRLTATPNANTPGVATVRRYAYVTLKEPLARSVVFKNASNQNITSIQSGNITAQLQYENNTGSAINVTFITALFEDLGNAESRLISIIPSDKVSNIANGATGSITQSTSLTVPSSGTYFIKAFMWDDINNMVPLKQPILLN